MPSVGYPVDLVKQFISNFEKKQRNLAKRKCKLDSYREKLGKGESLNDEQKKAVESYEGVVQNISLMQEIITNSKDLLISMESSVQEQETIIALEKERHTQSLLNIQVCLNRLINSLDIPSVRLAVVRCSSENHLRTLDNLRSLLTAPLIDGWPGSNPAALANTPLFLQKHDDVSVVAKNTYNFVTGQSLPIPFLEDSEEGHKKHTTFKEARNLCFRLLANPIIQHSLGRDITSCAVKKDEAMIQETPLEIPTEDKPSEAKVVAPSEAHDYCILSDQSNVQIVDKPVIDQVVRPLNSTFNFLQASQVEDTNLALQNPVIFDEKLAHLPDEPDITLFGRSHSQTDNAVHQLDPNHDEQYSLEIQRDVPEAEEFQPTVSSPVCDIPQISDHVLIATDEHDNATVSKPITYADSVRRTGQLTSNPLRSSNLENTSWNRRSERVPVEQNSRDFERSDQFAPRGLSRGGFRGRVPPGGRANLSRRITGQRANAHFSARGGSHRGFVAGVAQPTC